MNGVLLRRKFAKDCITSLDCIRPESGNVFWILFKTGSRLFMIIDIID